MTIELPIPPTANHLHTVARGRKIKSQAARDYAATVAWHMVEHRSRRPFDWQPGPGDRLRVIVSIYPKDHRRFDLANREKALVDSVFANLDADDSQIDVLTLKRMPVDPKNPRVILTVEAIK